MTRLKVFLRSVNFTSVDSRPPVMLRADIPKRIFLCGGGHKGNFRSKISKELESEKYENHECTVVLAEKALDLYENKNSNSDFLELERYIAALVYIIPIVCESAGSIAELGAFVNDIHIRDKVFIIIKKKYYSGNKSNSFVRRGLIKNYERSVSDKFGVYPINDRHSNKDIKEVTESIIEHPLKQTKCDFRLDYFQILLLADIINALVFSDKKKIKNHFEYAMKYAFPNDNEYITVYKEFEKRLDDMLFVLEELGIITLTDKRHYASISDSCWFLSYRSKGLKKQKKISEVRKQIFHEMHKDKEGM